MTMANAIVLADVDRAEFELAEATIERGLGTFVDVGEALLKVRAHPEWYRSADYSTFEDYCRRRWAFSRERGRQLMGAAEVVGSMPTIVGIDPPATESQARELVPVLREEGEVAMGEVWQEAVETAPNGKVTAAHVERVVERRVRMRKIPTESLGRLSVDKSRHAVSARRERIADMARHGHREEAIAESVGMSVMTVRHVMHALGIPTISQKIHRAPLPNANRIMDGIVTTAVTPREVLRALDWTSLDYGRFLEWDRQLTEAIQQLTGIRKRIRGLLP